MPPSTNKVVIRSLYRSLLRVSAPFSAPSPSAATYASLLHRSGVSHDWEACVYQSDRRRGAALREKKKKERIKKSGKGESASIPKSWAKNLAKSYTDLQMEYESKRGIFEEDEEEFWDDDEVALGMAMSTEHYNSEDDPKCVLFQHLLREWFAAGGSGDDNGDKKEEKWPKQWSPDEQGYYENGRIKQVPLMRFPCQILNGGGLSVKEMIQREFRAPTVDERLSMLDSELKGTDEPSKSSEKSTLTTFYPPSSYIDDEIRVQTAFYALMELNRKLAWADKIGFPASLQEETKQERNLKILVQAAKGVSPFPATKAKTKSKDVVDDTTSNNSETDNNNKELSPLQCGTYLIAHPLMTGYFAKTVIVLFDHVGEQKKAGTNSEQSSGGSYGLIINMHALQPELAESSLRQIEILRQNWEEQKKTQFEKEESLGSSSVSSNEENDSSGDKMAETKSSSDLSRSASVKSPPNHNILRPISLLQAMNADDLPETVQMSFGDSPVRIGGPVNLSMQMIHRNPVDTKDDGTGSNTEGGGKTTGSVSIGGTPLAAHHDVPQDSEDTIYFAGDVINASYAVLDGHSDRDDFSFIIGASCWSPGQLENEIQRGSWLPFRGPPQMALTGMVDHNDITTPAPENGENTEKGTKLSLFPPRPSNTAISSVAGSAANGTQQKAGQSVPRPVGDLWLSIMCALGEGEGDLGYMLLDNNNVNDKLGDACDNFDRRPV